MIRPILAASFTVALLAGCSSAESATETSEPAATTVVASHYPVQFLVDSIGGDAVDVETLTAPGAEPHDLELTPQQVAQVQDATAVFYIGGFQPAVDDAVAEASGTSVDLSEGLPLLEAEHSDEHSDEAEHSDEHSDEAEHGSTDPHVWLDPVPMGQMATTVADTLSASDPDNAATFEANATALQEQLASLDADWSDGTAGCQIPTMVVSHEAFGYPAAQYGFEQKGIAGLSPETEPSAQAIADLATFVKDNGVTTVYTETLVDPAVAQTVASEAGVTTATLDPLEGPPATGDYISAMQENLAAVQEGQDCS